MYELIISKGDVVCQPAILNGITLSSQRIGSPACLKFSIIQEDINFAEGNAVSFCVNGTKMFLGFIFTLIRDKNNVVTITAYDQLRYFKNKDTYCYQSKKASDILSMIAQDFNCNLGEIEDTNYIIPTRIEENSTLFDIVQNALDLTFENTNLCYVLFDNYGQICLKNISNMIVNILIDEETAQDFEYSSSIDSNSFNKVKLIYENSKTGVRDVYIAVDNDNINSWGVLQYFDSLKEGENGVAKAVSLMKLYDKKCKNLSIKNAFGDTRIRAGCMIVIKLDLGDIQVDNLMLIEAVTHIFNEGEHFMNLSLSGGEFSE